MITGSSPPTYEGSVEEYNHVGTFLYYLRIFDRRNSVYELKVLCQTWSINVGQEPSPPYVYTKVRHSYIIFILIIYVNSEKLFILNNRKIFAGSLKLNHADNAAILYKK